MLNQGATTIGGHELAEAKPATGSWVRVSNGVSEISASKGLPMWFASMCHIHWK